MNSYSCALTVLLNSSGIHTTKQQDDDEVEQPPRKKKRKNSKYHAYQKAPSRAVYFLFDVETTGSKRNFDKIISISFLAYDKKGRQLGSFSRLINPGSVAIDSYLTKKIHSTCMNTVLCLGRLPCLCPQSCMLLLHVTEISAHTVANKPQFEVVAKELNQWFERHLQGNKTGVLVSHNTPVDVQFLATEYLRSNMKLPEAVTLGLDTLATLRRFSALVYRKTTSADWPWNSDPDLITTKGKPTMGVKPCAMFALSKRQPPEKFEDACGNHHDAEADTRAVAVILFDSQQFGNKGLYHCVFKTEKKCFQPLTEVWGAMKVKMSEPVLKMEALPPGWVAAPVRNLMTCMLCQSFAHTFLFV